MFELAADPAAWTAPTGAGHWEVRDVFGHLIDTTETYFVGFDAVRGTVSAAAGTSGRDGHPRGRGAQELRSLEREAAIERLGVALDKMLGIEEALTEEDWGNLQVPHKYMGPLPAFFYPVFQLVDYAVHSWDIREGTGRPTHWRAVRPTCSSRSASCCGPRPRTSGRTPGRWSSGSASRPESTPAIRTSPSGQRA